MKWPLNQHATLLDILYTFFLLPLRYFIYNADEPLLSLAIDELMKDASSFGATGNPIVF